MENPGNSVQRIPSGSFTDIAHELAGAVVASWGDGESCTYESFCKLVDRISLGESPGFAAGAAAGPNAEYEAKETYRVCIEDDRDQFVTTDALKQALSDLGVAASAAAAFVAAASPTGGAVSEEMFVAAYLKTPLAVEYTYLLARECVRYFDRLPETPGRPVDYVRPAPAPRRAPPATFASAFGRLRSAIAI